MATRPRTVYFVIIGEACLLFGIVLQLVGFYTGAIGHVPGTGPYREAFVSQRTLTRMEVATLEQMDRDKEMRQIHEREERLSLALLQSRLDYEKSHARLAGIGIEPGPKREAAIAQAYYDCIEKMAKQGAAALAKSNPIVTTESCC